MLRRPARHRPFESARLRVRQPRTCSNASTRSRSGRRTSSAATSSRRRPTCACTPPAWRSRDLDAVRAALGYERINLYGRFLWHARGAALRAPLSPVHTHADPRRRGESRTWCWAPALPSMPSTRSSASCALHRTMRPAPRRSSIRLRTIARCARSSTAKPVRDHRQRGRHRPAHPLRLHHAAPVRGAEIRQLQRRPGRLVAAVAASGGARSRTSRRSRTSSACSRSSLEEAFAYGMHNSVACSEDTPLIDAAKLDRVALKATHMGAEQVQQLIEACQDWPKGVVDADLHAPLKSDAAALLLSGADDPVTPPAYAALAQRGVRRQQTRDHRRARAWPARRALRGSHHRELHRRGHRQGRSIPRCTAEAHAHAVLHHARGARALDAQKPAASTSPSARSRRCAA